MLFLLYKRSKIIVIMGRLTSNYNLPLPPLSLSISISLFSVRYMNHNYGLKDVFPRVFFYQTTQFSCAYRSELPQDGFTFHTSTFLACACSLERYCCITFQLENNFNFFSRLFFSFDDLFILEQPSANGVSLLLRNT